MRPNILNPLFAPVEKLTGVGPKMAANLTKLLRGNDAAEGARVGDLVFHLPASIIDRRNRPQISDAVEGVIATIKVRIDSHQPPPRGNKRVPYKIFTHDESGELCLVYFHGQGSWLEKQMPVGEERYVSGKVEWFNGQSNMVHPDYVVAADKLDDLPLVEPVYPLTAGISQKILSKAVRAAVNTIPDLPEWIDPSLVKKEHWPSTGEALTRLHNPRDILDLSPDSVSWRRLAYDELLAGQLALALVRARMKKSAGQAWSDNGEKRQTILNALPYTLTKAQSRSVDEILDDMKQPDRMLRLLQGDVGSGKTIVALLACAAAIEAGGQAALMAPTEILARQHLATIKPLAETAGISCAILTGREKGKEREEIYARLEAGEIDLLIGTHALFQGTVVFKNLALGIVDEQHRFGVHQ